MFSRVCRLPSSLSDTRSSSDVSREVIATVDQMKHTVTSTRFTDFTQFEPFFKYFGIMQVQSSVLFLDILKQKYNILYL